MIEGPLRNLKILDFSRLLPGPFATMMLADMGASVVKIEDVRHPDLLRYLPPLIDGVGAVYAHINRGKKSLALDLGTKQARDVIHRLVKEYDIIIEQFRPGVMDSMGLGYGELKLLNPALIYCSVTGYGQTGSYARRAGHDINYLALSGTEAVSGRKVGGPSLSGIQVADLGAGAKDCALAVCAAYIARAERGCGERIDISITDSVFAMTVFSTARFLAGDEEPRREEDGLNGGTLYDYYATADGQYLSIGPIEPKFFRTLCETIGEPGFADRGIGDSNLKIEIGRIIASKELSHWCDLFRNVDACVEPVRSLSQAVTHPPLSERDMVISVGTPSGSRVRQIAPAIKFSSCLLAPDESGAQLGQHSEDILLAAGYDAEDVLYLRSMGVLG